MKKGIRAQGIIQNIIIGAVVLFLLLAIGLTFWQGNGISGFGNSMNQAGEIFMSIFGPLFTSLLDLNGVNASNQFLVVLSFILISIIIVNTLDSVNIFGEDGKGNLLNFFVGLIVSIIGVRYMPQDIWSSLTAPSSAFVAAILLLIPLVALFFISMKIKYSVLSKLLWIFYIVFDVYLLFRLSDPGLRWVYGVALILSGIMLVFDSTVRAFFYKEKSKTEIADIIGAMNLKQRMKLRQEIKDMEEIVSDPNSPVADVTRAKARLNKLQKIYGDISAI